MFLTTHYMDEAQHLADRVAVMNAGEIIAIGQPEELGGRDLRPAEIRFSLPGAWSLGDPDVPCKQRKLEGDRVLVVTKDPVVAAQRITTWAVDHDVDLGHFSVSQPSLEDIYLELTGSVKKRKSRQFRRWFDERNCHHIAEAIAHAQPGPRRVADPHGQDLWRLAIWTGIGIFLMLRSLRRPEGGVG